MKTINKKLRAFREEKRLSRREFADILGCSEATVQNLEEKGSTVKVNYLTNLAKKFPNEIDYNEWLEVAAVAEVQTQINESGNDYDHTQPLSESYYEKQLVEILDEVERTFVNDEAKLQFAEVMLRMIRKRRENLEDPDS